MIVFVGEFPMLSVFRILTLFSVFCFLLAIPGLATDLTSINNTISDLQINLNFVWVLVSAALVFLMQAGFMCVESGLATANNSINVAIKNLADFVLAVIVFWIFGFGFMFGISDSGFIGMSDFFITLENPWMVAFFVFQAVFVGTAATIDSGAVAGRTKFSAYLVTSLAVSMIIYPIFGHWAWGSLFHGDAAAGWLEKMGFIDFAGSTVVHSVGGWVALAGCIVVGPRIGKYNKDGKAQHIPAHNLTLTYLGTFILFFGWFGFNCGSTLEANPDIAKIALNTMLSACFGCVASSALSWVFSPFKRPEGEMIANGILGGLVGITAGCAAVDTRGAAVIGLVSGILIYISINFMEKKLKIDDVVGAIGVHGICGAWGTIAVGIFITSENLGSVTRGHQIFVQAVGVITCFAWSFILAFILLKIISIFMGGIRVSAEDEKRGLNVAEHGAASTFSELAQSLTELSQGKGDLTVRLDVSGHDEIGILATRFNSFIDNLQVMIREIAEGVETLGQSSDKLSGISDAICEDSHQSSRKSGDVALASEALEGNMISIAALMEENSTNISMVASAAEELNSSITEITQNTHDAIRISDEATEKAVFSKTKIIELGEAATVINNIVGTITDIAGKIDILALNATIEASRAGDAGKGFAVVATEIKNLARQTSNAATDIAQKVKNIQTTSGSATDVIMDISQVVIDICETLKTISVNVDEQSKATREIAENITQVSTSVNEVSKNVSESSISAQNINNDISEIHLFSESMVENGDAIQINSASLSELATQLDKMVKRFRA